MRAQAVLAVDKMIGQLRATLAMLGEENNTYVVFSSDNGYHMGEYSLRPGKQTPFDTDIHVPLVIVGPGVAQGVVINAIAENVDLGPTFAELGGGSGAMSPDGHSLVPLFHGSEPPVWRHMALIEHKKPGPEITDPDLQVPNAANPTTYDALRLDGALYVEYEDGETSYYDIALDPWELSNIASSFTPAIRDGLHRMLAANKSCQGTPACWRAAQMTR
jgi:arylsulfatase A-like enzyme